MKIYFASRFKNKQKIIELSKTLEKNNHLIVSSWIHEPSLKPYFENENKCRFMAKKIESEIKKCDVFILLSDKGGTDMFIELGMAISNKNKIFLVGKWNKRSLLHFYPGFIYLESIKDIIKIL